MPCSYFRKNECKKNLDIRKGTLKQWKPTSTQRFWQSSKKSEHEGKKSDSVKKAVQGKKSDFSKKKSQKSRKKQNDEFSHEKSKTGRFFYRSLFLPGAFGGAFYPIYGNMNPNKIGEYTRKWLFFAKWTFKTKFNPRNTLSMLISASLSALGI